MNSTDTALTRSSLLRLRSFRFTLLASLGLPLACGGEVGKNPAGDSSNTNSGNPGSDNTSSSSTTGEPLSVGGFQSASSGGSGGSSSGGTSTSTSMVTGSTTGMGGSGGAMLVGCSNPVPREVAGMPTGFELCGEGYEVRVEERSCPNQLPPKAAGGASGVSNGACSEHADCPGALEFCQQDPLVGGYCAPGCETDADCNAGWICRCADPIGVCSEASCGTNADCPTDSLCAGVVDPICVDVHRYACQSQLDECRVDADCAGPAEWCTLLEGRRQCDTLPDCGRPFLVRSEVRRASASGRSDWGAALAPNTEGLSAEQRQQLGAHWTQIGLMEHASIAAFSRFNLQLLALGAPAELVEQTHQALVDEARHTRQAFALASAYLGAAQGPGPLATQDSLGSASLEELLVTTVLEGCIGETVAALEADTAQQRCGDQVVCDVLQGIAADEGRHASLAWQFVAFALEREPRLANVLLEACQRQQQDAAVGLPEPSLDALGLTAYGVVGQAERRWLRARVLSEVVLPCAEALAKRALGTSTSRAAQPSHQPASV